MFGTPENAKSRKTTHCYLVCCFSHDVPYSSSVCVCRLLYILCLEHRWHSYVRKNAVFALYSIHHEFKNLIPDAAELMYTFLIAESESTTCKRNALVFLAHCSMTKAVEYILSINDTIPALDEGL